MSPARFERYDGDRVVDCHGFPLLAEFNSAGVLVPADVHTAIRLARLGGETNPSVVLAAALATRAPRTGHVSVDLSTVRERAAADPSSPPDAAVALAALPWPEPEAWIAALGASPLVDSGRPGADARPLRLDDCHLYLDRYWRDELRLAIELIERTRPPSDVVAADPIWLGALLARLFPGPGAEEQKSAALMALNGHLAVIAGGPGTGKTTTVARLVAVLYEAAEQAGRRPPVVALAAPTGKAAARMEEAMRAEAAGINARPSTRASMAKLSGETLHRLLGSRPGQATRFNHHRAHRLPHDVVIVDEASMVSLAMMTRLAEAVRSDALLVLVGDPEQLVSVEAGAVLADIVASGAPGRPAAAFPIGGEQHQPIRDEQEPSVSPIAARLAVLRHNHRFGGALGAAADAIRGGDPDAVLRILAADDPEVRWIDIDPATIVEQAGEALPEVRRAAVAWAGEVATAAAEGDALRALEALRRHRLLCAHRDGPAGVAVWNEAVSSWLDDRARSPAREDWYPGRPVMATANDYLLRLYNGDAGVAVLSVPSSSEGGRGAELRVAFEAAGGGVRLVSPYRMSALETIYAMTVHKSQGSEYDQVTFLMPSSGSHILTRELLYTGITRARRQVMVVGTADAIATAVTTPVARATGLVRRLSPTIRP